jgi:purine nucleosidase
LSDLTPPRVLVDCDPGIDDALALLMLGTAHRNREIVVEGVFTVGGNVPSAQAARNAGLVLDRAGLPEVPVVEGANPGESWLERAAPSIHGANGLAGMVGDSSIVVRRSIAPGAEMSRSVRAAGLDLSLLCTGPLTNVALALSADPAAMSRVERIVVMGGAMGHPGGNVTPWAEFNFYSDPAAAAAVLSARLNVLLIPIDVTQRVVFRLEDFYGAQPFALELVRNDLRLYGEVLHLDGIYLHDAIAASALLEPGLFTFAPLGLRVVTDGQHAGQVERSSDPRSSVLVATDVDVSAVRSLVSGMLSRNQQERG